MKIEQLIVQYLYTNKKVTLQDIGVFYLSPNVTIPVEHDKDTAMPENAITFEFNTKAVQDDNLIDFIVQQTRKIKPLATSDLESFTILGRQFMNIGKPLPIEGLGILQKNQLGEYEFIQGNSINPKLEPLPALLREKDKGDIIFTTPARRQQSKAGAYALIAVFLVIVAATAIYFVSRNNKDKKTEELVTVKADSSNLTNTATQTAPTVTNKDTVVNIPVAPLPNASGFTFRVVIREYTTKATSDNVYKKFSSYGHKLMQYNTDTSTFKLAMPFTSSFTDTTRIKDSLQRLFGGKPYIEIY